MRDYLRAAMQALGVEEHQLARPKGRRGSKEGADVRRLTVALAREDGRSRAESAAAAGLDDPTSATFHLSAHRDLLITDEPYRTAYHAARRLLYGSGSMPEGVAIYGRGFLPGAPHVTHAISSAGEAICGTKLPKLLRADPVQIGPADLIGRRSDQGVLRIGHEELPRFVTCARCLSLLRS